MLSIRRSELLDPLDWESNMFPLYNYRLFFLSCFFPAILSPASIAWLRNNSKIYFILTNSLSAKEKGKSRIHSHSRAYFSLLDSCLLSLIIHSVQKQMFVKHTKKSITVGNIISATAACSHSVVYFFSCSHHFLSSHSKMITENHILAIQ